MKLATYIFLVSVAVRSTLAFQQSSGERFSFALSSGAEDRWDLVQKHMFLADEGDCGPPSNLYWGMKSRFSDAKVGGELPMCSYVDRWEVVQRHIFIADEGDPGPLPNGYWGVNAPRFSMGQRMNVDPRATSYDDRWPEVARRIAIADEGDCGVPPNLYWRQYKASMEASGDEALVEEAAPSLPPAQEQNAPSAWFSPAQEQNAPAIPFPNVMTNVVENVSA